MGDTFCALPWKHLTINPYGGAQVCCVSTAMVQDHGADASLYTTPLEDVFNSDGMRAIRQRMLTGKPSEECRNCYENEANGLKSERLLQNALWRDQYHFGQNEAVAATLPDGSTINDTPAYYQLLISNVCNLACRMCHSGSSSKIEADAIHNAWAPGNNSLSLPKWDESRISIGPARKLGVARLGIKMKNSAETRSFHIDGQATFSAPRLAEDIIGCYLSIETSTPPPWSIVVSVDDHPVFNASIHEKIVSQTIMFPEQEKVSKDISIKIKIGDSTAAQLKNIELIRKPGSGSKSDRTLSRFSEKKKPLFEQDSFLFHELLRNADTMQRLYVVGGEPFYAKPLLRMIDYLDDTGDCAHIDAVFTSNATIVNDKLLAQLQKFREVHIGFSIEGFGPIQEYIRYPSKWQEIETNIKKFRDIDGIKIHVVATLQLQSALYLTDLLRFCDKLQIACGVNLVYYPDYLNILALPRAARTAAAERLETYLENDNPSEACRNELLPIINHLTSDDDMFSHDLMRQFMLFTNDLDKGRQQSFRDTFPELLAFIEDTGFQWTDETRYFNKISKQKS